MSGIQKEPFIIIEVQVQPKSSRDEITGFQGGRMKIKVSAPPEHGKANERVREILAREFGVSKSKVEITKGRASRLKRVKIAGVDQGEYDSFVKKLMI